MAHVSEHKKEIVKNYVDDIAKYPVIAVANLESLPAQQLQNIRGQVRGTIELRMSRKKLMKLAIERSKEAKKNVEALTEHFDGMPALVFTKENPFKLFKILSKNKSSAPAKAGQKAPKDIIIQPGATQFAPGPVISELSSVGLKVGVEDGKVAVKEECTLVKGGEVITEEMANVLAKLGEKPMEVGLNLTAVYEKGTIFLRDVLDIDEEKFMNNLCEAGASALNLAVEIGYPTKDTIELLVGKAGLAAKAIAKECNILTSETVSDSLEAAERESLGLKDAAGVEIPEKKVEVKPKEAEKPVEEKKAEEKPKEEPAPVEEVKVEEKPVEEEAKTEEPKEEVKAEEEKPEEKPVEEQPKEKEPVEELAEEISQEVSKPSEDKKEEPRIKEPEPKPEQKPRVMDKTDREVDKMVQNMKDHESGEDKKKSAEFIVNEIETQEEIRKEERKKEDEVKEEKQQLKPGEIPKADDLAAKKKKDKAEKDEEQAKAEELFEELKKKGTLRE
tara:strand:- start:3191 stop:4696 length:1506 start_codon:yes stop_codon:yes gene_type:complete